MNIGTLLQSIPDFRNARQDDPAVSDWMARAYAILAEAGMSAEAAAVHLNMDMVTGTTAVTSMRIGYSNKIVASLRRGLAVAELRAPTSVRGAFINAGSAFDAMAAVGKVLAEAKTRARIVDPYMDEKALTDFAVLVAPSINIELLSDSATVKPSLKPAVDRWKSQYSSDRKVEARLAKARSLHDRLIILDGTTVYTLTQSLNAFAARSPASIVRLDGDAVPLKISAYNDFWNTASPL